MDAKEENVAYLVQRRFREVGEVGHRVRVLYVKQKHDAIHRSDWWMVRVEIDVPLEQLFRYYELLSQIEERLEKEDGVNTLIVPTIPEERAA